MDLTAYQKLAARTSSYRDATTPEEIAQRRDNARMGLFGELGEFIELHKKVVHHGHDAAALRDRMVDELGDVWWYLAEGATALAKPLESRGQATWSVPWWRLAQAAAANDHDSVVYLLPAFMDGLGISLDEVLGRNIQKLARRYPCQACGGAGRVIDHGFALDEDCPDCDGSGVAFSTQCSENREAS